MSQDGLTAKLAKAHSNVNKLCVFFAARLSWQVAEDARSALDELAAAAQAVDHRLRELIAAGGNEPTPPFRPDPEQIDEGVFDTAKLSRFTTFLNDLDSWFAAQSGPPRDPDGMVELRGMQSTLAGNLQFINALKKKAADAAPEQTGFAVNDSGATPAVSSIDPMPMDDEPGSVPQQLVLVDSDDQPLVQEFRGMQELTPECEQLVDRFLEAWEIEYSYYNRKKLLERIVRWVTSAPHGQVLVLKMKTIEEPYEPYPTYVSTDVLTAKTETDGQE
jgi:hypothetical protein